MRRDRARRVGFAALAGSGSLALSLLAAEALLRLTGHIDPITCVAFSPDGRHLATANGNGTVYILRLRSYSPPQ